MLNKNCIQSNNPFRIAIHKMSNKRLVFQEKCPLPLMTDRLRYPGICQRTFTVQQCKHLCINISVHGMKAVQLACLYWIRFNPIQARGRFVPPSPKSQHIFKTAWSLELLLWDFSLYVYSIQKSSVPPISRQVCCHGNHANFGLIFENSNIHCFSSISA